MKNVSKKILIMLLALMVLVTMIPSFAFSDDGDSEPVAPVQYQMGTEQVPITSYTLSVIVNNTYYPLTINRNGVITGMEALNAAYPDGIPKNCPCTVSINFDPSGIPQFHEGDTISLQLPSSLNVSYAFEGDSYEADGVTVVAHYSVTKDGLITFTPNPDAGERFTNGKIQFEGSLNQNSMNSENKIPVIIGGMEIDVPIHIEEAVEHRGYTLTKNVWRLSDQGGAIQTDSKGTYITWVMCVTADSNNTVDLTGIQVRETIPSTLLQYCQLDDQGRPQIEWFRNTVSTSNYPQDGASALVWDSTNNCWVWNVGRIRKGATNANAKRYMFIKMYLNDTYNGQNLTNKITSYKDGVQDKTATATYKEQLSLSINKSHGNPYINADGELCVDYTVTVPAQRYNTRNIEDAIVVDQFTQNGQYIKDVTNFQVWIRNSGSGNNQYVKYENYTGKYKDSSYTTYPSSMAPVWDPTAKKITWKVDRIPVCDSNILGGRRLTYTAIIDWDLGVNQGGDETNKNISLPKIVNTAKVTGSGKSASTSSDITISKKWIKKSGSYVDDGTFSRNGVVRYDIDLQENLQIDGHFVIKDELGVGAEYYNSGSGDSRGVRITRQNGTTVDNNFKVVLPFRETEPVVDAAGNKTYTSSATSGGVTFTLTEIDYADGSSEFQVDIPKTENYKYTLTYYAAPTANNPIGFINNTAGAGVIGEDGLDPVWHTYSVDTEVSHSAFIEKECLGVNPTTQTVMWVSTIKHNLVEGAVIEDFRDTSKTAADGYQNFYYTADQIDAIVIKVGDRTLERGVDYSLVADPTDASKFTITMLKDTEASSETPMKILYTATGEGFDGIDEGESVEYANKATLENDGLSADATAEGSYTRKVHISKYPGFDDNDDIKFEIVDGNLYIYWWIVINEEGDMVGNATVTDELVSGLKYVDAYLVRDRMEDGAKDTTMSASCITNAEGRDEVTMILDGLNPVSDGQAIIELKTLVTDSSILSHTGTDYVPNTAVLDYNGMLSSDDTSFLLYHQVIDKEGTYNAGTAPYIEFNVTINEDNINLVKDEHVDQITVVDTYDSRLEFKRGTFKLTRADGSEIPASEYNLQVDEQNHKFTFVIPDDETVYVYYRCFATGTEGSSYKATNNMSFYGIENSEIETETDINVTHGRGEMSTVKSLHITKRDQSGATLPGAEFTLYKVTVENGNLVYTKEGVSKVTDQDGVVRFYGSGGATVGLDTHTVYAFKETAAPEGYYITDANAAYRYFAYSDEVLTDEFNEAFERATAGSTTPVGVVIIGGSTYATDVTNHKGSITVNKAFVTTESFDGVYYFGLYDSDNETILQTGSITYAGGTALSQLTFTGLDFGRNEDGVLDGSPKTYYVYETDAQGRKLTRDGEGRVTVNGFKYTVSGEGPVTISASDAEASKSITITNTIGKMDIPVRKTWTDSDNQDGLRPTRIIVNLLADGEPVDEIELNAGNNWQGTFTDLPIYSNGREIEYTVEEETVENYTPTVAGDAETGFIITNSHDVLLIDIPVSKVWNDAFNNDGKRPSSITFILNGNGEEVARKTVTAADGWTWTFENMPVNANGQAINYTVSEPVVTYYTSSVTGDAENGFTVVNDHEPILKNLSGSKTWTDDDDQDGLRPEKIVVNLLANGTVVDTKEVTEDDNWAWTFTDKPVYFQGQEINYTIEEEVVANYTAEYDGLDIENTHTSYLIDIPVTKVWEDAFNNDGKRPSSITFILKADGTEVARKTVTADDNWTWTFEDMPVNKAGQRIVYTVEEPEVEYYTSEVTGDPENGFIVTNNHEIFLKDLDGVKTWTDADDQDGLRPEKIIVNLLANGEIVDTMEVTEEDDWAWTFTDKPVYFKGVEIEYTVSEEIIEGYEAVYDGMDIENIHEPELTSIDVMKIWDDHNDELKFRPPLINIILVADGEETDYVLELNEENQWMGTFEELPVYRDGGIPIDYTIVEEYVPDYEPIIEGNPEDGFVVTNALTWFDPNGDPDPDPDPKTGDESEPGMAMGLLLASGLLMVASRRKSQKKS